MELITDLLTSAFSFILGCNMSKISLISLSNNDFSKFLLLALRIHFGNFHVYMRYLNTSDNLRVAV